MAKVNPLLQASVELVTPEIPVLSTADKSYLKGLKKKGYSDQQIIAIAAKSGFKIEAQFLAVRPKLSEAERDAAKLAKEIAKEKREEVKAQKKIDFAKAKALRLQQSKQAAAPASSSLAERMSRPQPQ